MKGDCSMNDEQRKREQELGRLIVEAIRQEIEIHNRGEQAYIDLLHQRRAEGYTIVQEDFGSGQMYDAFTGEHLGDAPSEDDWPEHWYNCDCAEAEDVRFFSGGEIEEPLRQVMDLVLREDYEALAKILGIPYVQFQ